MPISINVARLMAVRSLQLADGWRLVPPTAAPGTTGWPFAPDEATRAAYAQAGQLHNQHQWWDALSGAWANLPFDQYRRSRWEGRRVGNGVIEVRRDLTQLSQAEANALFAFHAGLRQEAAELCRSA